MFVALTGIVTVILGGILLHSQQFSNFDFSITANFNSLHQGLFGSITSGVYAIFKPLPAIIWVILLAGICAWGRKSWQIGLIFALTVLFCWLPIAILKEIFARPRPDAELLTDPLQPTPLDWSYPSGHTVVVTIILVCLIIVTTGTEAQTPARILAPLGILLIFVTVLTVGVHFPTDSLASIIWGVTVTPAVWLLVENGVNRLSKMRSSTG